MEQFFWSGSDGVVFTENNKRGKQNRKYHQIAHQINPETKRVQFCMMCMFCCNNFSFLSIFYFSSGMVGPEYVALVHRWAWMG